MLNKIICLSVCHCSRDSDDSQTLRQKIGSYDWRPGHGKLGHKTQKHPYLWRVPKRTQNWNLFFNRN